MRFFSLLVVLLVSWTADAEQIQGTVVGVADGDTLTILDNDRKQYKIRLVGIDAPEKNQPYGQQSKRALSKMAFGRAVTVYWKKCDKYGRIVGKIAVNNQDINLEQLNSGMAWWYRQYAHEQTVVDRTLYEVAEDSAKKKRIGLWRDDNPTPPSAWRRANR